MRSVSPNLFCLKKFYRTAIIAYNSLYEWQEIEALELGNKKIDELRKEINNINIQMIKFSLLGETILEWNDKDIEHYHARRMAMDSMLCRFKATYPAERIDSVRQSSRG